LLALNSYQDSKRNKPNFRRRHNVPDQAQRALLPAFDLFELREGGLEPPRLAAPDPKADTTHRPMFSQVSPCRKHEAFSFSTPRQITSHQLRVGTEWALQGIED